MEPSTAPWLSNLDPDQQWDLDSLDHLMTHNIWYDDNNLPNSSITSADALPTSNRYSSTPNNLAKSVSNGSSCTQDLKSTAAPTILSFDNPYVDTTASDNRKKRSYETMSSPSAANRQEHVMAERIRREKLTQKFIALSAIVPGLKKMDKATVLGDAVEYLKQLQEQVKRLQDQLAANRAQGICSSCDESFEVDDHIRSLPEVQVRLSDKSVHMQIRCESRKGVLVKALAGIESLHLAVVNTSVVPFAGSSLDITVMAQIEEGFSLTVKDLVTNMNSALREFVSRS